MRVILAGGSGFLGQALASRLLADGHSVANLTRRAAPATPQEITWTPDGTATGAWVAALGSADAVVNLAGESVAGQRWSDERKRAIRDSRLRATRSLVEAITRAARPPRVFISSSAVGYYGPRGDEVVTESDAAGNDFLAQVAVDWEREAEQASAVTRVAIVRTGIVLHPSGGALAQMLLPFKLGIGGRLGTGRQFMPWIHLSDWVSLVTWLLTDPAPRGALNATAPEPVTNAEFTRTLSRALRRPAIFPVPTIALRVLFGEFAESLVTGQRAIPARAIEMGFRFRFERLEPALTHLLSHRDTESQS